MARWYTRLLISLLIVQSTGNNGHGLGKDTLVATSKGLVLIHELYSHVGKQSFDLLSYDLENKKALYQGFSAIAQGVSDVHIHIKLADGSCICCTPEQPFYLSDRERWQKAGYLYPGDHLLQVDNATIRVIDVEVLNGPLQVYSLEVPPIHVYCVGSSRVITHNMAIPLTVWTGIECFFGGATAGSAAGVLGGPVSFVGGLCIGGLGSLALKYLFSNKRAENYAYHSHISDWRIHRANHFCDHINLIGDVDSHNGYDSVMNFVSALDTAPSIDWTLLITPAADTIPNLLIDTREDEASYKAAVLEHVKKRKRPPLLCPCPCHLERIRDDDDGCTPCRNNQELHPYGIFRGGGYHNENSKGNGKSGKSEGADNFVGQLLLDHMSFLHPTQEKRRIAFDPSCLKLFIFTATADRLWHGYYVDWEQLKDNIKTKLKRLFDLNDKGNPS